MAMKTGTGPTPLSVFTLQPHPHGKGTPDHSTKATTNRTAVSRTRSRLGTMRAIFQRGEPLHVSALFTDTHPHISFGAFALSYVRTKRGGGSTRSIRGRRAKQRAQERAAAATLASTATFPTTASMPTSAPPSSPTSTHRDHARALADATDVCMSAAFRRRFMRGLNHLVRLDAGSTATRTPIPVSPSPPDTAASAAGRATHLSPPTVATRAPELVIVTAAAQQLTHFPMWCSWQALLPAFFGGEVKVTMAHEKEALAAADERGAILVVNSFNILSRAYSDRHNRRVFLMQTEQLIGNRVDKRVNRMLSYAPARAEAVFDSNPDQVDMLRQAGVHRAVLFPTTWAFTARPTSALTTRASYHSSADVVVLAPQGTATSGFTKRQEEQLARLRDLAAKSGVTVFAGRASLSKQRALLRRAKVLLFLHAHEGDTGLPLYTASLAMTACAVEPIVMVAEPCTLPRCTRGAGGKRRRGAGGRGAAAWEQAFQFSRDPVATAIALCCDTARSRRAWSKCQAAAASFWKTMSEAARDPAATLRLMGCDTNVAVTAADAARWWSYEREVGAGAHQSNPRELDGRARKRGRSDTSNH